MNPRVVGSFAGEVEAWEANRCLNLKWDQYDLYPL